MALTMYDISVPAFRRGLAVLMNYVDKAEAFAAQKGVEVSTLIEARLAPDMFTFGQQIQRASDKAKNGLARLAQVEPPKYADDEASPIQFKARLAKTIAFIDSLDQKLFEGSEERLLELKSRAATGSFRGDFYFLNLLLPDFYFHLTTAHDILRNQGVEIGKLDYFGKIH